MYKDLLVVDEHDRPTGRRDFWTCHHQGLRHRGSCVFVFRDASLSEVLLLRRSAHIVEPGKVANVGGHVDDGEDYLSTARNELREELFHGLPFPDLAFQELGKLRNDRPDNREFVTVFATVWPGPFRGDPREVEEVLGFVPLADVEKDVAAHPDRYTIDFPLHLGFLLGCLRRPG
ncbi:MAG: NUDIX domain-containing protein [Candidatus Aenigmarchaeota archaeon]|nr:NUDIX domain-containing protein [Candidatus Aenigmarchaeota archaeon]